MKGSTAMTTPADRSNEPCLLIGTMTDAIPVE
jgi:hypothetical protein